MHSTVPIRQEVELVYSQTVNNKILVFRCLSGATKLFERRQLFGLEIHRLFPQLSTSRVPVLSLQLCRCPRWGCTLRWPMGRCLTSVECGSVIPWTKIRIWLCENSEHKTPIVKCKPTHRSFGMNFSGTLNLALTSNHANQLPLPRCEALLVLSLTHVSSADLCPYYFYDHGILTNVWFRLNDLRHRVRYMCRPYVKPLDKCVLTNFDHDRQWFNTLIAPSHQTAAVTVDCISRASGSVIMVPFSVGLWYNKSSYCV